MAAAAGEAPGTGRQPLPARPGTLLSGRYRLAERIAAGAQADTWTAGDEILDRGVLVRLLHGGDEDPAAVARFRREALGVSRLSHPGILAVYDTIGGGGALGLVLEQVQATPLSRFLYEGGALSPAQALSIVLQVAEALEAAHSGGVRHLNLSPDTVWLCSDQRVKITDFGTVWHTGARGAPEALLSPTAEELADAEALGALLGECLRAAGAATELPAPAALLANDPAGAGFASPAEVRAAIVALGPLVSGAEPVPEDPDDDPDDDDPDDDEADYAGDGGHGRFERRPEPGTADAPAAPPLRRRTRLWPLAAVLLAAAALVGVALATTLPGNDGDQPAPPAPDPAVATTAAPATPAPPGEPASPPAPATTGVTTPETSAEVAEPTEPATPAPDPAGVAIVDVMVANFRRAGAGATEEPDALSTLDGDETTFWATPGLAAGDDTVDGVGLVFLLPEPRPLAELVLSSDTLGWTAAAYVAPGPGESLSEWGVLFDEQTNSSGTMRFDLAGQEAGAVLLWVPDPRAALTEQIRIAEVIIVAAEGPPVR